MERLRTIGQEELQDKRHSGRPDSPDLGTEGMQALFDAHPDLNTAVINENAEMQNANNAALAEEIAAVKEYADTLALQAGDVISVFGRAGAVEARAGDYTAEMVGAVPQQNFVPASNRNLLDNWYFADPINQRGQTEYTENGYSIDRWVLQAATEASLGVNTGFITVTGVRNDGIHQRLSTEQLTEGRTYTISVLTANGELLANTFTLSKAISIMAYNDLWSCAIGYFNDNAWQVYVAITYAESEQSIDLVAAKLELGTVQTLARKEGDRWVLNDPPPEQTLELLKCWQHYRRYVSSSAEPDNFFGFVSQSLSTVSVTTPAMRKTPAAAFSGQMILRGSKGYLDNTRLQNVKVKGVYNGSVLFAKQDDTAWTNVDDNSPVFAAMAAGAVLELSADL